MGLYKESYLKSADKILNFFYEMNSSVDNYIVVHREVPRLRGSNDCGLFCLAILISLCQGFEPSQLYFKQKEMRKHYK